MTLREDQVANRVHDLLMQSMRLQTLITQDNNKSVQWWPSTREEPRVVPQRGVAITQVCFTIYNNWLQQIQFFLPPFVRFRARSAVSKLNGECSCGGSGDNYMYVAHGLLLRVLKNTVPPVGRSV